jgi:hypothetical protein
MHSSWRAKPAKAGVTEITSDRNKYRGSCSADGLYFSLSWLTEILTGNYPAFPD